MKKIVFLLLAAIMLSSLCSCSLLNLNKEQSFLDCPLTKYENDDYNFIFKYPSLFKTMVITDSTENKDESVIEFKATDTNLITIYCKYNPQANLYDFIRENGFLPEKTYTVNQNVFIYDRRECDVGEKPSYYLIGATRRMIYIVEYKFMHGDEVSYAVCDRLSFDFSYYANTPKENASLSKDIVIAGGYLTLKTPANARLDFYPKSAIPQITEESETDEVQTEEQITKYISCSKAVVFGRDLFGSFFVNAVTPEHTKEEIKSGLLDSIYESIINSSSEGTLTNVELDEAAQYRYTSDTEYSILTFCCKYNGKDAHGSVMIGYGRRTQYFEFVYIITDNASEGEFKNYNDMLYSISM